MLEARNICKSFGDLKIIENFSFIVNSSEIVVLEGRSGTGKTTLMRIINNLEKADGGTLKVGHHTLFEDGIYSSKEEKIKYQRSVGMVFQNFALFPHMTVYENLAIAPKHLNLMSSEEIDRRANDVLEGLGIGEKINAYPSTLSGGQKQRVAVARAVMLEPPLICFDEPTSALDSDSIEGLIDLIKELKNKGMGVFIISHDSNFAKRVADKLLHTKDFLCK